MGRLTQPRIATAFRGRRFGDLRDTQVQVDWSDGTTTDLHHVVRHSPDGLEWGYMGSGPHDLALSLLAACAGREDAFPIATVLAVRDQLVAKLEGDLWELPASRILDVAAGAMAHLRVPRRSA
jgi:hypothetical protein